MKSILIIISFILSSSCGLLKSNPEATTMPSSNTVQEIAYNQILIEYSAISRGYFLNIRIEDQRIFVKKEQYGPGKIQDISETEWAILLDELNAINLNELSSLEAPTSKRQHDGAPVARLQITEDDLKNSTPEFDHGQPNSKIKPLVDYILALANKVE